MNFKPKNFIAVFVTVLLVVYIVYQSWFFISGPKIILNATDGFLATSSALTLSGQAVNVAWLTLNGQQIFTDEKGFWSESLLLPPGISIMTVKALDRFGREKSRSIRIIFNG